MTPPDGIPGRMQMYVFSGPTPHRDGDFDAGIMLHEYTHGLSNRLVGGGVGISAAQPRGMGEGWSDFYSLSLLTDPSADVNSNYATGGYATYQFNGLTQNYYFGIRRYPYTTDITKNPLTLKDIDPAQASAHTGIPRNPIVPATANEVHNMGEVWCVTLWEARANLINKLGGVAGNQLMLQLTTDGMKLSPANPTFLQARDAIIQADLVDTGGANRAELWAAFAKRGMGYSAFSPASSTTTGIVEAFDLPDNLSVSPFAPLSVTVNFGGPFPAQVFTLTNTGTTNLSWTAANTQPWLMLSATAGALAPGASTTVTASFSASANSLAVGTYNETVTFTNLASGRSISRAISLSIQPPRILFFDLNTDPGWSRTGEWAYGHPTGGGGAQGFPDPTNGATGTNVFGINLNGDYAITIAPAAYLTAGPFNFTGYANTRVQFQRWLNALVVGAVTESVEVSRNGTTWIKVWDNGSTLITSNAWTKVQYDISAVADNQPTVFIRWGHQVTANSAPAYSGWNIDDIELLGQTGASAPTITSQPLSQTATIGSNVTFSVSATGLPTPTYQWSFNGAPISGATTSTLTLTNVQVNNAGAYTVTVSNSLGSLTSATAILSGSAPAPIIVTPPANVVVTAGQSATFSVEVTGTDPLNYQWRRNGFPIAGATGSSLTLTNVSRTDADYYDVLIGAGLTATTSPSVRLSVAPRAYVTSVAPDPAWDLQLELTSGSGYAVAPLSDGRAYVAGSFTTINGLRRTSIARVNADGASIDTTFTPPEIDNIVRALAVQSDGKIVIVGDFVRVNGVLRNHIARLNLDGSVDATFATGIGANGQVFALAMQGDGRVLVGGSFVAYGGTARNFLVRLNSDGSVDSTFLTTGVNGTVNALALQSDGRILVGGAFTSYLDINGVTTARTRLARLNSNGTLDTTFTTALNSTVNALGVQSDGKIVVGGTFTTVGATVVGDIARLNNDGSLDTAFTMSGGTGFNGLISALAIQADGRILAGGSFTTYGGVTINRLARLNSDGTRDTTFLTLGFSSSVNGIALQGDGKLLVGGGFSSYLNPSNVGTSRSRFARLNGDGTLEAGFNFSIRGFGTVNTLVPLPGGKMLVTGIFNYVRGAASAIGLIRVNADGTIDPTFNPGGSGANSNVYSAVVQPDGKILISGFFTTYNGTVANGIARLNPDGTLDPTFNAGAGLGGGYKLAILPGGRVFVAGIFTTANGVVRNHVAIFGIDGTLDTTFGAGAGANATVNNAVVQPDGKIVIVGSFTTYNGTTTNRIARLNSDGTLDSTFNPGTAANSTIFDLALQLDGKILIGGSFSTYNGISRRGAARLNADGTLDPTFVPPTIIGSVLSLVAQEDGRVILRGTFTSVGGDSAAAYLVRLNANGSRDTTFAYGGIIDSNTSSSVLLIRDDGQLAMQSSGATGLTVTRNASVPVINTQPTNQVAIVGSTVTFAVSTSSVLPCTYQWRFNGAPIVGATSASLQLTNVRLAQAGSYSVVVANELGAVTSAAATLTVNKAPALVTLGNLAQTYDGMPRQITVTTIPAGLAVVVTYDGSTTAPTNAGSYAVNATVAEANYEGSAVGALTVAKATATITLGALTPTYDGTPKIATANTSPAGLNVSLTYDGSNTPPTNAGSYAVAAVVDDPNYTGATNGVLTIARAPVTIELISLVTIYDGTPKPVSAVTSPSGLNVTVTYNGGAAAPINAGSYSVAATVNNANYIGTASGTLLIAKAAAEVTLAGLSAVYDGTPKPATATTIPGGLTVSLTYDGSATAPTDAGSYAVVATINDTNYSGGANGTLAIAQAAQTITFNPVPGVTFGDLPFTVNATASSGLSVTFSIVSGPATIDGNIVTITDAGPVIVRAAQSGNPNYSAAPDVDQSFTVGKANQAITFDPIEGVTYGDVPFAVTASSNSGLVVSFSIVSGSATITGNTVTITGAGAVVVRASQVGDNNHNPAPNVDQTFTVGKANQAITFALLTDKTYGSAPFGVNGTSNVGLPVTFSIANGPATIDGNTVTITGAGTVIVRASQVGDDNYNPAPNVDQTFEVAKTALVVTAQNATRTYGTANPPLTFTYDGFVSSDTASDIDFAPTASTTALPASNVSSYPITVTDGLDNNYTFTYVAGTLQITPASQTISFLPIESKTYGDPAFTPPASTDSGLPVTLSVVSGPASVIDNVVTLTGAGDVTLRASQSGNGNYSAAPIADKSFTVAPASATIVLSNLIQVYTGTPKSVTVITDPLGLAVNLTYNGSTLLPTAAGSYTVLAKAANPNYTGLSTGVLVITPATSTVMLSDLVQAYTGTPKSATVTTTPANLAVNVTYNGSATRPIYPGSYAVVATVDGGDYTGSASGTFSITVTALVRHAPMINGGLDGSVQVLLPESFSINGSGWISDDLLMPGTPSLRLNGHPIFVGTRDAGGSSTPSGYQVTLNGGAALRYFVRQVDALALPVVAAPPTPTGTRSVAINSAGQSVGAFSTLRDLTLNGNAGQIFIPAGTYGNLTANGRNGFTLGEIGATTKTIYNLQNMTLSGNSQIVLLGPVIINLANGLSINGVVGTAVHPEWLTLNVAAGGVTLNSNAIFNGFVVAPTGTVTINGGATLSGGVTSDRLSINGNALLEQPAE